MTPAWISDTTGEDALIPWGARTMASIVLILSHPLLGHPEATVRTHLVGQSRNLWNRRWPWLGDFYLERLRICYSRGVGRDGACLERKRPDSRLGRSMGSDAACLGRNRPDITFQGSPFEATRMGSQNDCAVVPEPEVIFCLRN